ncbi:uncharacterized protein LOC131690353 [Topomyia yanbarensis]|uniref:uncharacterized protein LOC131690353 n=1 Tax=Topomyia yanbarensis TaxID=2498891 RepID=UPI00273BCE9B|nr:uncharacterized protein LOC131690353 [Topomyia yanbarensis]
MDKAVNFIIVSSLALIITFVCGNNDDNPFKDIANYHQWKPLAKWRQQFYPPSEAHQRSATDDRAEYDDDDASETPQDLQTIDFKSKRSRLRQPLCEVLVNIVYVGNGTDGYQYRPDHYVTESCLSTFNTFQNKCIETGLSCTQIRQKIFITRRKVASEDAKATNCWEHVRMEEIDAGCECMWPREHIGDKHSYRPGK